MHEAPNMVMNFPLADEIEKTLEDKIKRQSYKTFFIGFLFLLLILHVFYI